jgi:regulator of PEP synthase PpsR (kinase-PPPase family)
MAQRGYKVANYPLVPGESLPEELSEVEQDKIVALTIAPQRLAAIRSTRMKGLKMKASSNYAAMSNLKKELQWCNDLYRKRGWPVLDTTDAGIEENAAEIMRMLAARKGGPIKNAVTESYGNISPSCM